MTCTDVMITITLLEVNTKNSYSEEDNWKQVVRKKTIGNRLSERRQLK